MRHPQPYNEYGRVHTCTTISIYRRRFIRTYGTFSSPFVYMGSNSKSNIGLCTPAWIPAISSVRVISVFITLEYIQLARLCKIRIKLRPDVRTVFYCKYYFQAHVVAVLFGKYWSVKQRKAFPGDSSEFINFHAPKS